MPKKILKCMRFEIAARRFHASFLPKCYAKRENITVTLQVLQFYYNA